MEVIKVHRGASYVTTLKMLSTRSHNTECTNLANPFGFHLSDGALRTYLRGNEYEVGIFVLHECSELIRRYRTSLRPWLVVMVCCLVKIPDYLHRTGTSSLGSPPTTARRR
jgi:hypothetical protein